MRIKMEATSAAKVYSRHFADGEHVSVEVVVGVGGHVIGLELKITTPGRPTYFSVYDFGDIWELSQKLDLIGRIVRFMESEEGQG